MCENVEWNFKINYATGSYLETHSLPLSTKKNK